MMIAKPQFIMQKDFYDYLCFCIDQYEISKNNHGENSHDCNTAKKILVDLCNDWIEQGKAPKEFSQTKNGETVSFSTYNSKYWYFLRDTINNRLDR